MLEAHDIDLGWMAFFYSSSLTNIAHQKTRFVARIRQKEAKQAA